MRKFFITVLSLATLLAATLFSATFAQTSQVSYHNGDSVPLFQGTLAYQEGFSYDSLASYIISSDEAFYSAQYYGERTDTPVSIKLAVLDNYVVWQFDFADQVICIDAQDATNAYALPVDGIAYTYIIDDFSYNNAVYSNTDEAVSYANSASSSAAVYNNTVVSNTVVGNQENYNISSDGYNDLYGGYATYEAYLAAYTASVNQMAAAEAVVAPTVVDSYSEVVYLGNTSSTPSVSTASTISVQPALIAPAVVGPVENLGMIANTVGATYNASGYDAQGYDREGYDAEGYSYQGYDREGYNREGYSTVGYDREGYNREGYNTQGYDREGYNRIGFNSAGYNREGQTQ